MTSSYSGLKILLVDDSEDDTLMAKKVFAAMGFKHSLTTVADASEALDYLHCRGKYSGRKPELPDLMLLDISLPMMDGFALLRKLKADPVLKKIPVTMLTTSSSRDDITRSYEYGAASFITKPASFECFKDVICQFGRYWLSVSALPQ